MKLWTCLTAAFRVREAWYFAESQALIFLSAMVSPLDYFLLSFLEREESKFGRGTRLSTGSSCLWLEHDCSVPELCSPSLHGPESRPRGWASPLINVDGQSSEM